MKIVQSHKNFYVELSQDEIVICPKHGCCSLYPIWLGKNRAIMRDVIKFFEKNPPQSVNECLEIVGRFELNGMGSPKRKNDNFFSEDDSESIDNSKIFW